MTRASIRTRYAGPTNTRGSRIIVTEDSWGDHRPRKVIVSWDYALNPTQNHVAAAQAWLDTHNAGARVETPGLEFAHDCYFTWEME